MPMSQGHEEGGFIQVLESTCEITFSFFLFKKGLILLCVVCMLCLNAGICTMCMTGALGGQKRAWDPIELEL